MIQMHVAVFRNDWKWVSRVDSVDYENDPHPENGQLLYKVCWIQNTGRRVKRWDP